MRLAELQQRFAQAMLDDACPAPFALPQGLQIYRHTVRGTLIETLREMYPACCALVGEDFFRQVAWEFMRAHPPQRGCLLWWGEEFARFIATYAPASGVPYLVDSARYEWALHQARVAEDDVPLDPAWLEAQSEAALKAMSLVLCAGAGVLSSPYPLMSLYAYALAPEVQPMPELATANAEALAVWRDGGMVRTQQLNDAQYAILSAFATPCPLSEAVERAEPYGDPALALGSILGLRIVKLSRPSAME